jgi:tRNA A-37 threonylcarbamoyl transferase component Bud32
MDDQRLVQLALDYGYVTAEQVRAAEREAQTLADRGLDRGVLFVLEDLGYLSDSQMRKLRRQTSSAHIRALVVEDYVLRGRVGSGGMGEVFRGERDDGKAVAIKLLPQRMLDTEEYLGRFRREARILEKLMHPNITAFGSAGLVDGRPYVIMELVEGLSLKALIEERGPLPPGDVLTVLRQMAEALRFAWSFGVVHRDVKPSNIILGAARPGQREPFCAKLCDFGLAKTVVRIDDDTASLTKSGMAVGTPHYMSPEVATGSDVLEPGIDIYSLGATIYHALTGSTLYSGKSSAVIMYKQATARIDVNDIPADRAPPAIRRLLADMLAKDRRTRIGDWDTVLERLRQLEIDPGSVAMAAIGAVSRGRAAVRPWAFAHLTLILATVVLFLAAVLLFWLRSDGDRIELSARPGQLQEQLQRAEEELAAGHQISLVLEPGIYPAPWTFSRAHSGLQIRAAGQGVLLRGAEGLAQPLITVGAGCRDLRLHGLSLEGGSGGGFQIDAEAEVHLGALAMHAVGGDGLRIDGGVLRLQGGRLDGLQSGIVATGGARLVLADLLLIAGGVLIDGDDAVIDVERGRLRYRGASEIPTAILLRGGGLSLRQVEIEAGAAAVACTLERCGPVSLVDVRLREGRTGLRVFNSAISQVIGLEIQASEVGIHWSGSWDRLWTWRGQRVMAPEPLRGEAIQGLPVDGRGADPAIDRLLPLP